MNRISDFRYSELIIAALDCFPPQTSNKLASIDFLTGISPIYAGLGIIEKSEDGRSVHNLAAVWYSWNQTCCSKSTTIVLPSIKSLTVVVHELAHVLDEILGFRYLLEPCTEYAKKNRYEAFAEAYCSWRFWNYGEEVDTQARLLFEGLD